MSSEPVCPKCQSTYTYADRELWVCPSCAHEWSRTSAAAAAVQVDVSIRDAFGNVLADGDAVSVIKDLKVRGASSVVKMGTKVKNIRLVESDDGHNIDCKIDGFGSMSLKSEFVKKI